MAKPSKRLVIDASIARSAAEGPIPDLLPAQCRAVLDAVLEICHRVALGPEGLAEWKRHRSRYARAWLTRMAARRKLVLLEDCRNEGLRVKLVALDLADKERRALDKDLHLVEAALLCDRIVLSRDETLRVLLQKICPDIAEVRAILWGNPERGDEDVCGWLAEGAKTQAARRLGG